MEFYSGTNLINLIHIIRATPKAKEKNQRVYRGLLILTKIHLISDLRMKMPMDVHQSPSLLLGQLPRRRYSFIWRLCKRQLKRANQPLPILYRHVYR
jgi:hypothetical protein